MQRIIEAFNWALNYLKIVAPKDTGNLAFNAIKYEILGDTMRIYVDEDIAPYMVYTNEEWINRKGVNPNQQWWNDAVEQIIGYMAFYLGSELKTIQGVSL